MKNVRNTFLAVWALSLTISGYSQTPVPDFTLEVNYHNMPLAECFHDISNKTDLTFAYRSNLLSSIPLVSISFQRIALTDLLDTLLYPNGLGYIYSNRQIILTPKPIKKTIQFRGCILNRNDSLPVPYASISLKTKALGTISDFKGVYEWDLSKEYKTDSVIISSMGFQKRIISVNDLRGFNGKYIFLEEATITLPPVYVNRREYKLEDLGNTGNFSSGSIYLDTHGQQIGLYIENRHNIPGQLLSISFYVSEEGNGSAPLRVRLYTVDSSSMKPGRDILQEILIVQPDINKGWYSVDLREYHIYFPVNGLFVALEGIFPNDYDYYSSSNDFIDISDKTVSSTVESGVPKTISYGQRIGYNRRKAKNTWNYSLSHTWFQLERQNFGVMIKATVKIEKHRHKREKHRK